MAIAMLVLTGCASAGKITAMPMTSQTAPTTTRRSPTTTSPTSAPSPGSANSDDRLLPSTGNGGYDVRHYDLDISLSDDRKTITGTTVISATATQALSAFNLDLNGMDVSSVAVNGDPATIDRAGSELTITPKTAIDTDQKFTTTINYSGTPTLVIDPTAPTPAGWLVANSGVYVASEPIGAKSFFPCNDHPSDKATYKIALTASSKDLAVANGVLTDTVAAGDRTTSTYEMRQPMATYLVQVAIGDYDLITHEGPHGLPLRDVVVRNLDAAGRDALQVTADQIAFFEQHFGPYPFDTYGLLVADSPASFALETQTLTLLPAEWLNDSSNSGPFVRQVMAHELAHQWFGDSVSPAQWSDIWLNEGFATYAEWMWADHDDTASIDESVADAYSSSATYRQRYGSVTSPKAADLFSSNEYDGAGIVLHALRLTVGDDTFFRILRTWAKEFGGKSAVTADFEKLAEHIAQRDLTQFFDAWLRSVDLPPLPK